MYCIVPIQYCNVMYCISNFSDKVVFQFTTCNGLRKQFFAFVYDVQDRVGINKRCLFSFF